MNKKFLISLLLVSAILLAACGSSGAENASDAGNGSGSEAPVSNPDAQPGSGSAPELPLSSKLALGTLKLEETEFAVTPEQASELLPLWQVLRSLTSSDTSVQQEVNAVVDQIQETMTPEQLAAIDTMGISNESLFTSMQELGLVGQATVSGTPQPGGNFQGGGGFPGGGTGGGGGPGGFNPEGGQLTPDQIATAQALREANNGGNGLRSRMLTPLIEAVIELLETR